MILTLNLGTLYKKSVDWERHRGTRVTTRATEAGTQQDVWIWLFSMLRSKDNPPRPAQIYGDNEISSRVH